MTMRAFLKFIDWIEKLCIFCSFFAVGAILLLTVLDVVLRKVSHYGVPGLYEFTQDYLMVTLVFLSISHVYRLGGHVRVTLFQRAIPTILKKPLQKITDSLVLLFLLVIVYTGYNAAIEAWRFKEVSSNILAYPLAPALFLVPIGCGLTMIRVIQSLLCPRSLANS